uniref:Uncharacterized protein n=1 Tax=Paramormyrops kingsleyae TaxID=1676925 RepID=A0A3B3RHI2_9TELE
MYHKLIGLTEKLRGHVMPERFRIHYIKPGPHPTRLGAEPSDLGQPGCIDLSLTVSVPLQMDRSPVQLKQGILDKLLYCPTQNKWTHLLLFPLSDFANGLILLLLELALLL